MDTTTIDRLSKDIKQAAKTLSFREARYLVDLYYQMQDNRKRAGSQIGAMTKDAEPHATLDWFSTQSTTLESRTKAILDSYSEGFEIGRWSREIVGIGPVIAAGLIAYIDIRRGDKRPGCDCCKEPKERARLIKARKLKPKDPVCAGHPIETVGHIWRYAGLDPTTVWERGVRRPWNAQLKTLCWKIGESFVKVSNRKDDVYGKIYIQRKAYEIARNETGYNREVALEKAKKVGKATDAYKSYSIGKLPPAHVHARAKRYAVKLFLSHWFEAAYQFEFGVAPPLPYPIAILGHAHKI